MPQVPVGGPVQMPPQGPYERLMAEFMDDLLGMKDLTGLDEDRAYRAPGPMMPGAGQRAADRVKGVMAEMRVDPERFSEAVQRMPFSTNIEDRRWQGELGKVPGRFEGLPFAF